MILTNSISSCITSNFVTLLPLLVQFVYSVMIYVYSYFNSDFNLLICFYLLHIRSIMVEKVLFSCKKWKFDFEPQNMFSPRFMQPWKHLVWCLSVCAYVCDWFLVTTIPPKPLNRIPWNFKQCFPPISSRIYQFLADIACPGTWVRTEAPTDFI